MSKKYNEIMDQVRVTDEMKQRVLQNVKEGIETEKIPESGKIIHSRFLSYGRTSRYLSVAACIMMLLVGGLTVPQLLHRGNGLPQDPTGTAVGTAPWQALKCRDQKSLRMRQAARLVPWLETAWWKWIPLQNFPSPLVFLCWK